MKRVISFFVVTLIVLLTFSPAIASYNGKTSVYITSSGEKYHCYGCGSLWNSSFEISLVNAVERGYSPCGRCHPPRLNGYPSYNPASVKSDMISASSDDEETFFDRIPEIIWMPFYVIVFGGGFLFVSYFLTPLLISYGKDAAVKLFNKRRESNRKVKRYHMDITLERILSLMPCKPDGSLAHGAKKSFAENIGLKSGNVIADWLAGKSKSYNGYVYEIADKYNVSVEWLKGETDDKTKKAAPLAGSDLNPKYFDLTPENRALIDQMIDQLSKAQSAD